MNPSYSYLLIDIGTIAIPLLFSFHPKLRFDRQWRYFFPACAIAGLVFILWDIKYTELGVWSFNPVYLTGVQIVNLPLEECLFFLCIPYACVFTYHCLGLLLKLPRGNKLTHVLTAVLVVSLLVIGASHTGKYYTSVTFISLAVTLALLQWVVRVMWMRQFLFSYAVLLLPFFVVNGLLTGSWIDDAIVKYDDMENLGLRLGTIPVEDIFYGMLLILLNVALMEYFKWQFGSEQGASARLAGT
jgi:lycopene cyclase domain-containing protein